jgi:radical SAM superfamily enzyme YgiQ (UPF0313 family)
MSPLSPIRVCLISPPTVTDFEDPAVAESKAVRLIAEHAPIGILSLAAVLEVQGVRPTIIDLNRVYYDYLRSTERSSEMKFSSYVTSRITQSDYDVVGLGTICSSYPLTLRIAKELKESRPGIQIILGGPQASVVDVSTMRAFPSIDCIVRGEAEDSLPAVIHALSGQGYHELLPGITFRNGSNIVRTPNSPVVLDLDLLPLPAFHLYPELRQCSYVPLELGRGCPFGCTFCSTNDFFRRRFRLKSPDRMLAQMKLIKETYGIGTFDLIHDMFTVDRKRVVAFCEALLTAGEEFFWNCSARTDCVDNDLIALMARAGCRGMFFGIETGSARLQKVIKKNLELAEAERHIETADNHNITTAVSLITGFPDETMEDLTDSVNFILNALRFDHAQPQLHLLAPLAETPLHTQHRESLIFDDIISDMSYQGWRQDGSDRAIIQSHPDVFPNFYSIPTPNLDHSYLREIREFILNGTERFRWLTVALHQGCGGARNVFEAFREWYANASGRGPEHPSEAPAYYAGIRFQTEFLEFARATYASSAGKFARVIAALLDHAQVASTAVANANAETAPQEVSPNSPDILLSLDAVPRLAKGIHLVEAGGSFKTIAGCLRRKADMRKIRLQKTKLITRTDSEGQIDLIQLSSLSAKLLVLCDGTSTIREIASQMVGTGYRLSGIPPEKTCLFGVEFLRQQGVLVLSRSIEVAVN